MKSTRVIICIGIAMLSIVLIAGGDRLPNQTPENQLFSIDTVLDATGFVDDVNSLKWVVASPGAIPDGVLGYTQSIADFTYKDSILSNGGKLSENKNFDFDSQDKAEGLYNLETGKILTYASTEGAHLVGEEEYTLDVAGNWANINDNIRCVFSGNGVGVPAFCNSISARSNLVNMNSAQVSTKGILRVVTDSISNPTELSYRIAVSPDANSGSRYADGTVSTVFAGSVMEARGGNDYRSENPTWNKTAATRTWKDSTAVTGGIKNFQKVFGDPSYQSGILNPQDAPPFENASSPSPTPTLCITGTITVQNSHPSDIYVQYGLYGTAPLSNLGSIPAGGSATTPPLPSGYYQVTAGADTQFVTIQCGNVQTQL